MKKAKLQLALDDVLLEDALELVRSVAGFVDVIEIGTPLIEREGMRAVRALRQSCPDKEILADTKIMDAGEYAATIAFEAGADYCTVLGCTDLITIGGCLKAAEKFGRKAVVDMICVDDLEARARKLESIGVNCIAAPLSDLRTLRAAARKSEVFVAGGIKPNTVENYLAAGADVIIVGAGITKAEDPVAAARAFREKIQ